MRVRARHMTGIGIRAAVVGALAAAVLLASGWLRAVASTVPSGVIVTRTVAADRAIEQIPYVDQTTEPEPDDASVIEAPIRTDMLTVNWKGTADEVFVRARGGDDSWSRWTLAPAAETEAPDDTTDEGERVEAMAKEASGGKLSVPVWLGDATHLQVGTRQGSITWLQLTYVNSTGTATASDRLATSAKQTAADLLGAVDDDAGAVPSRPGVVSRSGWGADESRRRGTPNYAESLKAAAVHHTVTANSYSRSQAKAVVRGIYLSHLGNGWDDIGYNFLVDRYGTVYEGRSGGMTKPVIGAHALGFNTGSVGVALLGTYSGVTPGSAQRSSLQRLLSWRLDLEHVSPVKRVSLTSGATDNTKYPAGSKASVYGVFGHRDVYSTACPGGGAYARLGSIRNAVWKQGGAKMARPRQLLSQRSNGSIGGLRVRANGNKYLRWTVTFRSKSTNKILKRIRRNGTNLDYRWNGVSGTTRQFPWDVSYTINARRGTNRARPYSRSVSNAPPPPLDMSYRGRVAGVISPNGDKLNDRQIIRMNNNVPSTLHVELLNEAQQILATVADGVEVGAGKVSYAWDGTAGGSTVQDGIYRLKIVGTDALGNSDSFITPAFAVDDTLAVFGVSRFYSPNGDGRREAIVSRVRIRGTATTTVWLERGGSTIDTYVDGATADELIESRFAAFSPLGTPMPDGTYKLRARAVTTDRTLTASRIFTVDTRRPNGTFRRRSSGRMRVCVYEPVVATFRIRDRGRWRTRKLKLRRGCRTLKRLSSARFVTLEDRAKNRRTLRLRRA